MTVFPKSNSFIAMGTGLCLFTATHTTADIAPFHEAYQVPASQKAVFAVAGPATQGDVQGDAFLHSVTYPGSQIYTEFYRPEAVSHLRVAAEDAEGLTIRGGNNITEGVPGRRALSGFATGTPSPEDIPAFSEAITDVMASRNLNYYIDMSGAPDFSFVIAFERPVRDNHPRPQTP